MFSEIMALLLSVVQIVSSFALGVIHTQVSPVEYGGIPFEEPVVSRWLTLIEGGESDYVIVKGAECAPSENEAASQLQEYLYRVSGKRLEISTDMSRVREREILVGKTNREGGGYTVDRKALGDEGFCVMVHEQKLIIAGGELRGTLYGVFNFLEQQLGCRWFTPELEVIPASPTVKIDADLNYKQTAYFEYRDDYWNSAFNADWKVRHKINSNNGGFLGEHYGGGISYADFCHSMDRMVPIAYFEEHPEYFSYREDVGQWTTHQRCLANPDVLALTIQNARASILAHPHAKIMSITQNDNGEYCQCPDCKASDALYGGPSGTNIWFVNQVAAALEAEFPQVAFDTFAYQYTRQPSVNIVPRDNVIVRLCSIECCFTHPLAECGHERNEPIGEMFRPKDSSFARDIRGWADICDRLYIWDYTTNFNLYLNLFPNFHVLSPNMQFFVDNNVKGVFEQGNYTGGKSGEFGELRAYILAKLLWDPYCDVEYHMMDFMRAYYGVEAADAIKDYIDTITNKSVNTDHLFIFDWHYQGCYFTKAERRRIDALWDAAENSAADGFQRDNVRRSRLSWRHHKANMMLDEFSYLNPLKHYRENEKLYNDIVELGITRLTETRPLTQTPNFWLRPVEWKD